MDLLTSIRVFRQVVMRGSFTKAAEDLDMSTAMASKHVTNLEQHVQARLLMRTSRRTDSRELEISEISRSLKGLAKELHVPVIALSQLNRSLETRTDKRPVMADLRESGAIEQDADIVMFLYRDDYYNEDSEKRNIAECIVAKNRHGETGKVELRWMPEYTTFATLENRYDEDD